MTVNAGADGLQPLLPLPDGPEMCLACPGRVQGHLLHRIYSNGHI